MSQPCTLPPCPPCPPPPPPPCPQICPPRPPMAPCRVKPIMRGLHWAQTKRVLAQSLVASSIGGALVYLLVGRPRMAAYREYYLRGEFDEWEDEMARKGLFQAVPPEALAEPSQKAKSGKK